MEFNIENFPFGGKDDGVEVDTDDMGRLNMFLNGCAIVNRGEANA